MAGHSPMLTLRGHHNEIDEVGGLEFFVPGKAHGHGVGRLAWRHMIPHWKGTLGKGGFNDYIFSQVRAPSYLRSFFMSINLHHFREKRES